MSEADFKYLNIPALLDRKAWVAAENSADGLIEDREWTKRLAERLFSLVLFFRNSGLLTETADNSVEISKIVLRFSDFTSEGKLFVRSGAPDKWLESFDRNPDKASTDVSYLIRRLESQRSKGDVGKKKS